MSAKTTWEDLSRLGYPINDVFVKANAQRGGTMKNKDDLFLNSGIAAEYQYVLSSPPSRSCTLTLLAGGGRTT
jgi:hypothetical protein